jgi:DNA repair protein RecO
MSYVTYTTKALVCGIWNRRTADRTYLLFTKEAGMLYATARSVREERSRQRYALQEFSLIRASLIKGRHDWKIGSVEVEKNYYQTALDRSVRGSVASLVRLLRRFVKGEEAVPDLFNSTVEFLEFLSLDIPQRRFVQLVLEIRLLAQLGYVDMQKFPSTISQSDPFSIPKCYSPELAVEIETFYTHAVTVSQL